MPDFEIYCIITVFALNVKLKKDIYCADFPIVFLSVRFSVCKFVCLIFNVFSVCLNCILHVRFFPYLSIILLRKDNFSLSSCIRKKIQIKYYTGLPMRNMELLVNMYN